MQAKYLNNHFSNTKFSVSQFKGSHGVLKKAERQEIREVMTRAKSYDDLDALVGGIWNGAEEMREITQAIEMRDRGFAPPQTTLGPAKEAQAAEASAVPEHDAELATDEEDDDGPVTPKEYRANPEPQTLGTPFLPINEHTNVIPAMIAREDAPTPTPC